jgi:predicted RNase H-like HicB family nuclease
VHFPDIPGCFSAADDLNELLPNAMEALSLYAEDTELPAPSPIEKLLSKPDVASDLTTGAFLIAVPMIAKPDP